MVETVLQTGVLVKEVIAIDPTLGQSLSLVDAITKRPHIVSVCFCKVDHYDAEFLLQLCQEAHQFGNLG